MKNMALITIWLILSLLISGCDKSPSPSQEAKQPKQSLTPEAEYEAATKSNTLDSYRSFLQKYPDHPLSTEANSKMLEVKNDLIVDGMNMLKRPSGIRSNPNLKPWDKLLDNDRANIFALAQKGIAKACEGDFDSASSCFKDVKTYNTGDVKLAPMLVQVAIANKYGRLITLVAPVPSSVTNRGVSLKYRNIGSANKSTFGIEEKGDIALLKDMGMIQESNLPKKGAKNLISKIMDSNVDALFVNAFNGR